MSGGGGGDIPLPDFAGERLADCRGDRVEVDDTGESGEGAEQRRVWERPANMLEGEFGGWHHAGVARPQRSRTVARPSSASVRLLLTRR